MLLSEHCNIQPSEWDKMPFYQYQYMLDFKINNTKNQQTQQQQQSQQFDMNSMMRSQSKMVSSMSKNTSFKLPSIKF